MIKLICKNCGHVWYTANTKRNQKCSECEWKLVEIQLTVAKDIGANLQNEV